MIRTVVHGEGVFLTIERELALGDAVGHTACDGPEEWVPFQIAIEIVEPKDNIAELAVAIGYPELRENCAVFGDLRNRASPVGEGVDFNVGAVGHLAENVGFD